MGQNKSIYQLNPENGAIISEIQNIRTEGIALLDDYLYYINVNIINKVEKNGTTSGGYLLEVDRNKWSAIYPSSNDTSHLPLYYTLEHPKTKKTDSLTQELIKHQIILIILLGLQSHLNEQKLQDPQ